MSKGYSTNGLFVDTGLLRDHVSKLREEKKIATRLYEKVVAMRDLSDPALAYQYHPITRDILQLIEYYERMAKLLDNISDDAVDLSHKINSLIAEDTDQARYVSSKSIML